jgi:hypothetical protein
LAELADLLIIFPALSFSTEEKPIGFAEANKIFLEGIGFTLFPKLEER